MTPLEQVLQAWREAERVLEHLPALSSERDAVTRAVESPRQTYQDLMAQEAELVRIGDSATRTVPETHACSTASIERTMTTARPPSGDALNDLARERTTNRQAQ